MLPPEPSPPTPPQPPSVPFLGFNDTNASAGNPAPLDSRAPLPDFEVVAVTSRPLAQEGTHLEITASIRNAGALFVSGVRVGFYDDKIAAESLFAVSNATFLTMDAPATATWTAAGLATHTLYAVADVYEEVEEWNETNNARGVDVNVVSYPPGRPELYVTPEGIRTNDLLQIGKPSWMNITVGNSGEAAAMNVPVSIVELPTNITVATYTIVVLTSSSTDDHAIMWTPSGSERSLKVAVDSDDTILEWDEGNNTAETTFQVQPAGLYAVLQGGPAVLCTGPFTPILFYQGDVTVPPGTDIGWTDCVVVINGNLLVSGTLRVLRTRVYFVQCLLVPIGVLCTPVPGARRLDVAYGGQLLSVGASTSRSVFSAFASSYAQSFRFLLQSGSILDMAWSTVLYTYSVKGYDCPSPYATPGGVQLYTSSATIRDSTIVSRGHGHGVYIGTGVSGPAIQGSIVSDHGCGGGVVVASGAFASISGNSFSGNWDGVYAGSSSPNLQGNVFTSNVHAGIFGFNTQALVSNNNLAHQLSGAWFSGTPSYGPTVQGNVFDDNRFGLYAIGATAHVTGNNQVALGKGSARSGVVVSYAIADISGNTFTLNPFGISDAQNSYGMVCDGCPSGSSVSSNDFDDYYENTGNHAVYVRSSPSVTLQLNTLTNSTFSVTYDRSGGAILYNTIDKVSPAVWNWYAWGSGVFVNELPADTPLSISWNTFNNVSYTIYLVHSSPRVDNNTLLHYIYGKDYPFRVQTYYEAERTQILAYYGSSPTIDNNTILGSAFGITLEPATGGSIPSSPLIKYNRIAKTGYKAIAEGCAGFTCPDTNAPVIVNNWINESWGAALVAETSAVYNASHNFIRDTYGITTFHYLDTGQFTQAHWGAVSVLGTGEISLWDNTITGSTLWAVRAGDSTHPRIVGNVLQENAEGIQLGRNVAAAFRASGNNISRNDKGVVYYGPRTTTVPFVLDGPNSFWSNRIAIGLKDPGGGLGVTTEGLLGVANQAGFVGNDFGVVVGGSTSLVARPVIRDSNISGSWIAGIWSEDSSPVVEDLELWSNLYGIAVLGSDAREVSNPALRSRVDGTSIRLGYMGVWAEDADLDLDAGSRLESFGDGFGVALTNSDIDMEYTTILGAKTGVGAYMSSSGAVLYGNVSVAQIGVYLNGTKRVLVKGNDFWDTSTAVYASASADVWTEDNSVLNPLWSDVRYGLLYRNIHLSQGIEITGNHVWNTNQGIYLHDVNLTEPRVVRVSGNNLSFVGIPALPLGVAIKVEGSAAAFDIRDNGLWKVDIGIRVDSSPTAELEIEGNDVYVLDGGSSYDWGILTEVPAKIIGNNTVGFLRVDDSDITEQNGIRRDLGFVYNNTVKGFYYGIRLEELSQPAKLWNNTLTGNSFGIRAYGGSVGALTRIVGNAITGNTNGIWAAGGAVPGYATPTVERNNISGNRAWGIVIATAGLQNLDVVGNTVTYNGPAGGGISIEGTSRATIRDNNTIAHNQPYGILIGPDAAIFPGQVWWNTILGNGVGIYVPSAPPGGFFHAECNWWNDTDGPNDPSPGLPDQRTNPAGQYVSDFFHYRNETAPPPPQVQFWWLRSPSSQATFCRYP